MYLTTKQHDAFRTLLMGFEIPYRKYIADIIMTAFPKKEDFENAMCNKKSQLSIESPEFLKQVLPGACNHNKLVREYDRFAFAQSSVDEIVSEDIELPMVGLLNLVTFAFTELFGDLHTLFVDYNRFCALAETYRYCRNKLDHPGSRTLEDSHLTPTLTFVKDICNILDDKCFLQKSREELLEEVNALQKRKIPIPVEIHNFRDMPFSDSRIVCRTAELGIIKAFVYGNPDDLRKQHSLCIYGYGGVGKTALVLEAVKQIVGDIQDGVAVNEYAPQYMLFFSAKKRKLELAAETGRVIEKQLNCHFETADELKKLILSEIKQESLRGFRNEGLVIVDNLETLSLEERQKVKEFVERQTPSEMQFILTSRNSEDYEKNYKLAGFDAEVGKTFMTEYSNENSLELSLSEKEKEDLLLLAKGNTLVLVLSMRRLSSHYASFAGLKQEFNTQNAWKSLKNTLANTPSNAYEVIAEFMYKDTFEHLETAFSENTDLFYKVMKVFAVISGGSTDISTLCFLAHESYPDVETVVDILCNFLILEKNDTQYALNGFAEKYIISRFMPDKETYLRLSDNIEKRQKEVNSSLKQLESHMNRSTPLTRIINDWKIFTDVDRITAAQVYNMYGEVRDACRKNSQFHLRGSMEDFVKKCREAESLTAHPFIKFEKARILMMVDNSQILPEKHVDEIKKCFIDAIYGVATIPHYADIQQTKSYASLLWLYGQYLYDIEELSDAIRFLEKGKSSFEDQKLEEEHYFQCVTMLGHAYLDYYEQNKAEHVRYLRQARGIDKLLYANRSKFRKAISHSLKLRDRLKAYVQY